MRLWQSSNLISHRLWESRHRQRVRVLGPATVYGRPKLTCRTGRARSILARKLPLAEWVGGGIVEVEFVDVQQFSDGGLAAAVGLLRAGVDRDCNRPALDV
jgi:hypothetical protein